ncbi:DNA-directed RNA polymerase III subunit RPC4 [Nematostella vectensis]|uniref:DNA-directed RNA polymerase III subunit RPC4 n=1 Tax=Nematostella vectensis TaxID=45351 RepID=UPI0020776AA7|nr:DNA-directed RNA polymerase III subunit RPC4 [Nematostella vectensis]
MAEQSLKNNTEKKDAAPKTPGSSLLGARALLSRQLGTSSSTSPGRLPSLRPARDLTLGGTPKVTLGGAQKRTFTPNIPTRRVKEEPKDASQTERQKSERRGRGDNKRGKDSGRGRGRGRGRGNEIVSSPSVFSMGPAEKSRIGQTVVPTTGPSGGSKSVDKKASSATKTERKGDFCDDEESKRILRMLNVGSEGGENESEEYGMAPVQIPLSQYQYQEAVSDTKPKILPGLIKEEPMDVDEPDVKPPKPVKPQAIRKAGSATETDIPFSTLFSCEPEEEKLMFFQFPDKLPIRPSNQAEPMSTNQESSNDTNQETKADKPLTLRNVSEGYIGKLQVLKSGKARLMLGEVVLDVAMGTSCSFLQDVVAVHTGEQRTDMTVLGHLNHKLICTPDYERLLTS